MPDTDQTSVEEPVVDPTPDPEPASDSNDSTSKTAQPTVEELQAKLNRLENNYKGTFQEWNREKQERERLQNIINERMAAPPPPPPKKDPEYPSDEELAKREHAAIIDGDMPTLASIRKIQREKSTSEAASQLSEMIQTVSNTQRQQSSLSNYLKSRGITDTSSPLYQQVSNRAREIANDQNYSFAHGNMANIVAIAANEVIAKSNHGLQDASDAARDLAANAAVTEPGKNNGKIPGAKPATDKIYLTQLEKDKGVKILMRAYHIGETEATKKYWENLSPEIKEKRKQEGRASA